VKPPRVPSWLRRALHPRHRDAILGDLYEEHASRARLGRWKAHLWLYLHVLRSAVSGRVLTGLERGEPKKQRLRGELLRTLGQDYLLSIRSLRAKPLVSGVALGTLALGIGATAAMFSVVNAVLLRPLPYEAADKLVHVRGILNEDERGNNVSYADFLELRDRSATLSAVSAWQGWEVTIDNGSGTPARRRAASVSYDFFEVLGARPVRGRFFTIEEEAPGHAPVVVISYALWQSVYGGDPAAIGKPVRLEGETYTLIGVAPPDFVDPVVAASPWASPDVWRSHPPVFDLAAENRTWRGFWAIGRLARGRSVADAAAEMRVLADNLAESFPESNTGFGFGIVSVHDQLVGDARPAVLALIGAVCLLLLIACANVANLLLSRAASRRQEVAIRTALGAGRRRLIRQLLTESAGLALLGGALGLVLARVGISALVILAGDGLPRAETIGLDTDVFVFTFGASLLTALVFGLGPALHLTGASLSQAIGSSSRGGAARASHRLGGGLVVAEIAMAVVLLVAAGLFLKSMATLVRVDSGLVASGVLTLRVTPAIETYSDDALTRVVDELLHRVETIPGVESAGAISDLPMNGTANSVWMFRDDKPRPKSGDEPIVLIRAISPDYFRTMGIRLEGGRSFDDRDSSDAPAVAIINGVVARRHFPTEDPIGKHISLMGVSREIVAVSGDVRQFGLAQESQPAVYTPYPQQQEEWLRRSVSVVLRTDGDPALWAGAVRRVIREVDVSIPVNDLVPMATIVDDDVSQPRFRTVLLTTFASLAVLLASVGIGSVMAYRVSQRTREIAVRVALGADRRSITAMVLREGASLTAWGVGLGVVGGLLGGRLVSGLLFGVAPYDVTVVVAVVSLLAAVSLLSSYLPALRATRVSPRSALSSE